MIGIGIAIALFTAGTGEVADDHRTLPEPSAILMGEGWRIDTRRPRKTPRDVTGQRVWPGSAVLCRADESIKRLYDVYNEIEIFSITNGAWLELQTEMIKECGVRIFILTEHATHKFLFIYNGPVLEGNEKSRFESAIKDVPVVFLDQRYGVLQFRTKARKAMKAYMQSLSQCSADKVEPENR